ncbi:LpxD N-terminal domain-containing protein [Dongshaea marina]|uniref:LpxD N-terminal domain-containing protein n=1 Tax=Dongshaea marina TaxID=2047966 RepID=UPI00190175D1|nr:LpxD N-terminal domain-containing protein [Dongshaea marina]
MKMTLSELSSELGAQFYGDGNVGINDTAGLNNAKSGFLSFISHKKHYHYLSNTEASAVLLRPDDLSYCNTNAIVVPNPYHSLRF